jgi:hypothetical protein
MASAPQGARRGLRVTGQNSEQVPSPIAGDTRLKVLLRSVEEIDRELDEIAAGAPAARRDIALDASSLARVDEVLTSLHGASAREELAWSAPAPAAEPPSTAPEEARPVTEPALEAEPLADAPPEFALASGEAAAPSLPPQELADISFSQPPVEALEEDVPRQLLDFEPAAAPGDGLATILDVPDLTLEETPALPSAVETVIVAPEGAPVSAQSALPLVDEPLFLSVPPSLAVPDFEMEAPPAGPVAAPEGQGAAREEAVAPELGAAVESMLIDEDEVVVEAAASTPPDAVEAQVVVDADEVLVEEAPAAATGTLLGLAPTFRPGSAAPSRPPENDLGEVVFNLEPELEMAKAPPASLRPLLASSPPAAHPGQQRRGARTEAAAEGA